MVVGLAAGSSSLCRTQHPKLMLALYSLQGLQPSRVGSLLHGASCCAQPSALPISSRDNQKPATSQLDGVAHGKAAPLPETAGAVEGPAKPVALSELGAWGADLSLVLKIRVE
ncbi:hypothetical protein ACKKBG_A08515 [Auxenochlorella protothecoides x Auxenochlorella symbiontica]